MYMTHIVLMGKQVSEKRREVAASLTSSWDPRAPLHALPSPRPFLFPLNSLRGPFGKEANILQPSHEVTGNGEGALRETGSGIC